MKNILYTIILSLLFSFSMFADRKAANNAYAADPLLEDVLMNVMVLAEQGDAESQYNLALMYERGDIVTQDYKEAVKWYRLAAEQEYVFAQFNLGLMYKYGKGVTRDYKEAVRLYLLAAEQGNARAQQNLGVMYYEGLGVIKNIVISYMWLNIAASKGEKNAKNNLGVAKRNMTSEQIAKAQELARECIEKNYKDCG